MIAFLGRRLAQGVLVVVLASMVIFLLVRLIPGDPAILVAGEDASDEEIAGIREDLGLDQPIFTQYVDWVSRLLRGDLGASFFNKVPVSRLVRQGLPPTLELAAAAIVLALVLGVPLGILAGLRPGGAWDYFASLFNVVTLGIPNFVLGVILLFVFSVQLGWFPVAGRVAVTDDPLTALRGLVLPAIALGSALAATIGRFVRSSIAEVMSQDYVRTARAKGLAEWRVVLRHAMPNAMIPVVTVVALQVGRLLGGAIVIEIVFTRPGFGRTIVQAISSRDYLVIQAMLAILVVIFIAVNTIADVMYGYLDPRIRMEER